MNFEEKEKEANLSDIEQQKKEVGMEQHQQQLTVSQIFQKKMDKFSKNFMTTHALLSSFGAITYSIVIIMATNQWEVGLARPGWHIDGDFLPNTILANCLAVVVNLNLCFAALLVLGFYKQNRQLVKLWCVGQFFVHLLVTVILVLSSVVYDCRLAATLAIPPFLYYTIALSFARQLVVTISIQKSQT